MSKNPGLVELKDKEGNLTGHLIGIFNRTTFLLENRIKPIWVFDGKPPDAKMQGTIVERQDRRDKANEERKDAEELGDPVAVKKAAGNSTIITKSMHVDAVKLCELMGVAYIHAPSEAEA